MKARDFSPELIEAARAVRERAYAPYSEFLVGAALLGRSGRIYAGCNVENVSFGLSLCAERAALARAVAEGERSFKALCVVSRSTRPTPPCGSCRQGLREFCKDLPILLLNLNGARIRLCLSDLLPRAFDKSYF